MSKKSRFTIADLVKKGFNITEDGVFSKTANVVVVKQEVPIAAKRKLELVLLGEPMPKQSVRSTKSGHFYQPQKMKDRIKDYQNQIAIQLPKGFKMFEEQVHITKMHFVFSPLKGFSKSKMDDIKQGKLVYKTTKPDLPDNLKKLVNDSMSGFVFKDDSIIVSEDNVKKYYGTGGCIIVNLEGV